MRRVLWLFALVLLAGVPLPALSQTPAPGATSAPTATAPAETIVPKASAPAAAAADEGDGWNFEDEEEKEPTWFELIEQQSVDLGVFTAFVILAMTGFFMKSEKVKVATLIASVIFLGFGRSQLYSITNIFSLLTGNLPIFKHSLFWYFFATFTLGTTVIWGRLYCGRLCAFGALTQLMDRFVPKKWQLKIPVKVEQNAYYFKYALLVFVIGYYLTTHNILVSRYVEPFWMFGALANFEAFTAVPGAWLLWGMLAALLLASIVVRNLYCRFICPVGTFLGIISSITTIFRIKRWSECKSCTICERACEWGAIQGPRIIRSECVRCDDCERIYDDTKKCVHWIVIERKDVLLARAAARTAAAQARAQS